MQALQAKELQTHEVVLESFWDFWVACDNPQYTHFVCKGGRNSAKSTTISQRLDFDIIDKPINTLVIRKVEKDIYNTVYQQLRKSINLMGLQNEFEYYKSPMKITYKARGNGFIFRGADNPGSFKSITSSEFPITQIWFEEADQFKTEDEIQIIIDSILREILPNGMTYKFFYSYNPPKRKQHWLNKKFETQFIPANTYVHHSYYYDNPFLAQQALDEMESVKKTNIRKYNWMYLGEPTGGGIVPFENLNFRAITDEEIKTFDNIRQGIDWGYATHPFCFGRMHFDKKKSLLYIYDEIFGIQISNRKVADQMIAKNYHTILTTADCAEPKSISEMKDYGIKIIGAVKGAGSVEYGEKWLNDLTEIIIDPVRCPGIAKQFEDIDYKVDKDGNLQAELEDVENDAIDMTRYGMERDMQRPGIRFLNSRN
jgi:PBSX family phage terminase large subunit